MVYLTVADGAFVKTDRDTMAVDSEDYVIYTQLQGSGVSGVGSMGIMRMVSAIDVQWVADLIPLLKDPVDVQRLSNK